MLLTPAATECPTLNTAVNGDAIAPNNPVPTPLKKPFAPYYFAFLNGFVKIPVIPSASSTTPPLTP